MHVFNQRGRNVSDVAQPWIARALAIMIGRVLQGTRGTFGTAPRLHSASNISTFIPHFAFVQLFI